MSEPPPPRLPLHILTLVLLLPPPRLHSPIRPLDKALEEEDSTTQLQPQTRCHLQPTRSIRQVLKPSKHISCIEFYEFKP